MDNKTIVVTLYGTGNAIDDFTVTLFDEDHNFSFRYNEDTITQNYCNNVNRLKLKDDNWIYAFVVKENRKIKFRKPYDIDFNILGTLDNRSIQKVLREVDSKELSKALKSVKKETLKAVLRNMSKRAGRMLIEDMEYMGPVREIEVKEAQEKIARIMRHLEDYGQIIVPKSSQDVILSDSRKT